MASGLLHFEYMEVHLKNSDLMTVDSLPIDTTVETALQVGSHLRDEMGMASNLFRRHLL